MSVNRYRLLRFAEYASIFTSVLGAIATLSTRQLAYAIAPLSISVALNLASRRQQQQRLEQHLTQTLTQCNQRFERVSQQSKLLQQNLSALTQTTQQQAAGSAATEACQTLENTLNPRIQTLSDEIQAIQHNLGRQGQQMSTFASLSSFEELSANLHQVQTSLVNISAQAEENLERQMQNLAQRQQQIVNEQQSTLARSITGLEGDILKLRSDLAYLRQDLDSLIVQLKEPPSPPEDTVPSAAPEVPTISDEEPAVDFTHIIPHLPVDQNYDLDINLGIDFGTGFTKVCFRDLAQDKAEIVTFVEPEAIPNGLSLDQTLIPTKIAILQDNTLLTGLTMAEWQAGNYPIRQAVDFIKMRLAHLDLPNESDWRLEEIPELDDPATVESLCAYYLSQVINRAQEWIQTHRSDLFVNQTVRWSINIGVPVEYCDSPALERFQRVLSLAWVLNYTPQETAALTIPKLNQLIAHLQHWMVENSIGNLDCSTTPEITAAVWSVLSSRSAEDGFYTFFDIGDGTLDGTAFRFWRTEEGDLHMDFYKGKVEPLGVTAFTQQAATELDSSPETIRQALTDTSDHDLKSKIQKSQVRHKVQQLVGTVVIQGNKKHRNSRHVFVNDDIGKNLQVFVGGGGGNASFFQDAIQSTHREFQQGNAGIPPYKIRQILPPKDFLSINGLDPKEFNRFAVAYGLCIPEWEGPEIRLPSQIETNKTPIRQVISRPARYEDTKDMM